MGLVAFQTPRGSGCTSAIASADIWDGSISLFLERAIALMENFGSRPSDHWSGCELILAKLREVL
jgi:hypothetical protein